MSKDLTRFLGEPISILLSSSPFKEGRFERTVESDLPELRIYYEFVGSGVSVLCDGSERVVAIFLESEHDYPDIWGINFNSSREEVRGILGAPSKVGEPFKHPVLGEYGPWDLFGKVTYSIHIEYLPDANKIRRVTLKQSM